MIERKALQFFYLDLALRVPILQKWCSRSKTRLAAGLSFTIWCALSLHKRRKESSFMRRKSALPRMFWKCQVKQCESLASQDAPFIFSEKPAPEHLLPQLVPWWHVVYDGSVQLFLCVANQYTPNWCKLKNNLKKIIYNSNNCNELIYSVASESVVQALWNRQWTNVWEQLLGRKRFLICLCCQSQYILYSCPETGSKLVACSMKTGREASK